MSEKRNPFEIFKKFPHFNQDFLQDMADMDWNNPGEIFNTLAEDKWPPVDLMESYNELIVLVEIPGLQRAGDVRVKLRGNVLELEGEKAEPIALQNARVHKQERRRGNFNRTVTLPAAVSNKYTRATYEKGILEIRLTKVPDNQFETINIDFSK